jgi:hypothetical protein
MPIKEVRSLFIEPLLMVAITHAIFVLQVRAEPIRNERVRVDRRLQNFALSFSYFQRKPYVGLQRVRSRQVTQ